MANESLVRDIAKNVMMWKKVTVTVVGVCKIQVIVFQSSKFGG